MRVVWWGRLRARDKPSFCCMAHLAEISSQEGSQWVHGSQTLKYYSETSHIQKVLGHISGTKNMKLSFTNCPYCVSLRKQLRHSGFGMLTWNRVLIMILKPSKEPIHSREDLAPVAESFWCHCHVLYPVRSSECRRAQEMTGCFRAIPATEQHPHTKRSQSEQARPTNSGDGHTDNEQTDVPKTLSFSFQTIAPKYHAFPCKNLSVTAYTPVTPPAQGSTAVAAIWLETQGSPG